MARRGFPPVAPPAAVLVVLLVAAAAGGARGLRGNAAQPRKLAAGGSGDSPRRRAAELVKESSHASVMGGGHIPPLQLILAEEGNAEGAVCLDGSAPGFYYRKGYGSGQHNWVLFFEGGAWCASPHACEYRARMHLGSTKHARSVAVMLDRQNGSMQGMLSNNRTVNPDFYNWNAVYFIYCDGGSFSGHQDQPVRFNGIPLYMRGRRVADLLVKHLMEQKGLGHAKKVVVSGSSAGGVALLLHCDRVRDTLTAASPSMHVRYLADASMFLDIPDSDNTHRIAAFFSEVQTMHVKSHHQEGKASYVVDTASACTHTALPSWPCTPSMPYVSLPSLFYLALPFFPYLAIPFISYLSFLTPLAVTQLSFLTLPHLSPPCLTLLHRSPLLRFRLPQGSGEHSGASRPLLACQRRLPLLLLPARLHPLGRPLDDAHGKGRANVQGCEPLDAPRQHRRD